MGSSKYLFNAISIIILIVIWSAALVTANHSEVTDTVTIKMYQRIDGKNRYLIFTKDDIFIVNNAKLFKQIKRYKTYTFKVRGKQLPFSSLPVIYDIRKSF